MPTALKAQFGGVRSGVPELRHFSRHGVMMLTSQRRVIGMSICRWAVSKTLRFVRIQDGQTAAKGTRTKKSDLLTKTVVGMISSYAGYDPRSCPHAEVSKRVIESERRNDFGKGLV